MTVLVPVRELMNRESSSKASETVLLVEDEASIRELFRKVLEGLGYTVLGAATPEEALEVGRGHAGPIHLLLTDIVMPRMGGAELASRVVALRPKIRVLYMSGYTDEVMVRQGLAADEVDFLQKPFTPEELTSRVRAVLDADKRGQ
jgi:two-component system, cell cycle sensor histidine kinase and response regulator CckA